MEVCQGRFGYYIIRWKTVNAKIPVKHLKNPSDTPLDEAKLMQEFRNWDTVTKIKCREELTAVMPPKPKRPFPSYLLFCADMRLEVMDNVKRLGEVLKDLSRQWSRLEDKSFYESKTASAKIYL